MNEIFREKKYIFVIIISCSMITEQLNAQGIQKIWVSWNLNVEDRKDMKLFQSVQEYYGMLGLYPSQSNSNSSFNSKIVFILFNCIHGCISTAAFCVFAANTLQEFGESYFASATEMFTIGCFLSSIWQWPTTLKTIENLEDFIQKSKLKLSLENIHKICLLEENGN